MRVRCRVLVNRHETTEVTQGQKIFRAARCDISLFDDFLFFRPYVAPASYNKTVISFLKRDKALRVASSKILSAHAATW